MRKGERVLERERKEKAEKTAMAEGVERSEENRCSRKRGREREAQDEAQDEVSTNASLAAAKRTR